MANEQRPPMRPPVPRDYEDASFSELVPFRSSKIKLVRSPLFLLALLVAVITPLLFGLMDGALGAKDQQTRMTMAVTISMIAVFFVVMMFQLVVFLYARTDRSIWHYLATFLISAALIQVPVLATPYMIVFRQILPGQYDPNIQYTFIQQFIVMFFAAGLMEELMKATPILIGAFLMRRVLDTRAEPNALVRLLGVRGPLDGAVMGIFAGGGFIFIETAFQYVPTTMAQTLQSSSDPSAAIASGLLLLLPRVFGGLVGHMAYSGLFGYFIGLAVIRPNQIWKLLGIGWLSASVIHALWNSVPVISPLLSYAVAILAAVVVVGAILKARELDARGRGAATESFGSIVVERPAPVPLAAAPAVHRHAPATAAPPSITFAPGALLELEIDGLRIALRAGGMIDLAAEPALGGRGRDITGAVVPHPTRPDVLGLRNTGATGWTARLRDGSQQRIERDQNIRLARGVDIDFGSGLIGKVVGLG